MKVDRKDRARIDLSVAGDNTVIAAPGDGRHIAIDHLNFLCSGAANTIQLKEGADTVITEYAFDDNQAFAFDNANPDLNTLEVRTNLAFVMNLSASAAVTGFVLYRVVGE